MTSLFAQNQLVGIKGIKMGSDEGLLQTFSSSICKAPPSTPKINTKFIFFKFFDVRILTIYKNLSLSYCHYANLL